MDAPPQRNRRALVALIELRYRVPSDWLLTGEVPVQREWAPRDSNPQPTDYARRPRHLRAVAA
jgi:hypothetical protein